MRLIESILKQNPCYKKGKKIDVKGLMLHSVGCPQPSASVFVKNWNSPNFSQACVHAFIDANTGDIYQTLPWNHRGWHGGGTSNNTHIGVEMCEPACIRYVGGANFVCSDPDAAKAAVTKTYNAAVELFAFLCEKYGLNPLADGVIVSHKEGHTRGIASNHGDPEHLWTQLKTGHAMNGFRNDVKAAMKGAIITTAPSVPVTPSISKETEVSYQVRVSIANLNIRSQPTSSSASKGYITPGVYTIVTESDGAGASRWGKLKSGIGWISLDYCTKLSSGTIQTVSELDQAVDKLAKLGVINSPDYWKKAAGTLQYLDDLIIKASVKITGAGTRSSSVTAAIDQLVKDGIIGSPEYWRANYQKCPSLDALLCALAGAKKG